MDMDVINRSWYRVWEASVPHVVWWTNFCAGCDVALLQLEENTSAKWS